MTPADRARADFEAAYARAFPNIVGLFPNKFSRDSNGDYIDAGAFVGWAIWQEAIRVLKPRKE